LDNKFKVGTMAKMAIGHMSLTRNQDGSLVRRRQESAFVHVKVCTCQFWKFSAAQTWTTESAARDNSVMSFLPTSFYDLLILLYSLPVDIYIKECALGGPHFQLVY